MSDLGKMLVIYFLTIALVIAGAIALPIITDNFNQDKYDSKYNGEVNR